MLRRNAHNATKAVVDADIDHILGYAVLGIEGGEVMGMIRKP